MVGVEGWLVYNNLNPFDKCYPGYARAAGGFPKRGRFSFLFLPAGSAFLTERRSDNSVGQYRGESEYLIRYNICFVSQLGS